MSKFKKVLKKHIETHAYNTPVSISLTDLKTINTSEIFACQKCDKKDKCKEKESTIQYCWEYKGVNN